MAQGKKEVPSDTSVSPFEVTLVQAFFFEHLGKQAHVSQRECVSSQFFFVNGS